ncbi:hypothetical protein A0H76_1275 [Hepatospora eriocheir]|uniref:Uncharacterized protein n=1 Tax=Hepatospora eriocheir TaxID=1081669 RepID=A0A1X0QHB9_9MICR|nr:hypothetical protein A0H76_1275 [Hepatospora eriocheir]
MNLFLDVVKSTINKDLFDNFMKINGINNFTNNFGNRVDGLWVFGMAEQGFRKSKMFLVEKRDRNTLLTVF